MSPPSPTFAALRASKLAIAHDVGHSVFLSYLIQHRTSCPRCRLLASIVESRSLDATSGGPVM